jgi:phosphatidylserine/phosphatidylglycerophosphate/cardiolipin synthase-like enzyme
VKVLTGPGVAAELKAAIDAAVRVIRLSVFIASAHWKGQQPGQIDLLDTLCRATGRGVEGRAVLAQISQKWCRETPNIGAAERLLEAGWFVRLHRGPRLLHEKTLVIDERLCMVGSHNLSVSSIARNHEISLLIDSPELAGQLRAIWWSRWNEAFDARAALEEIRTHGPRTAARRTARTGRDLLRAAGLR